jgi:hypothetical protein
LKTILFLFIEFLFIFSELNAQKAKQEIGLAVYNISFGGLVSGIGSVINKKPEETVGGTFLRGFKWGCVGGSFTYLGKRLSYPINSQRQLLFAWPSKLVHDIGTSIIVNSAKNTGVFDSYRTQIGFVRFDIEIKGRIKVHPRVMPFALGSFIYGSFRGKLDLNKTILIGTPTFRADISLFRGGFRGASGLNTIHIPDTSSFYSYNTLAHEHNHILQESQYFSLAVWLTPLDKKFKKESNLTLYGRLSKYIYLDIPFQRIPRIFMRYSLRCYYRNYLELEAEHFATNSFIRKCY